MNKIFTGFAAALAAAAVAGSAAVVWAEDTAETTDDTNAAAQLITYEAPAGVDINGSYKVKARPHGAGDDAWQELDVYTVQVMSNGVRNSAMTYFDCTGTIDVEVTVTGGVDYFDDIDETTGEKKGLLAKGTTTEFTPADGATVDTPIDTRIYPESYNIEPQYEEGGDTISFTVEPGQRIVLDPNGDTRRNLQIWADYPIDMPTVEELESEGKTVAVVDASNGDNLEMSYDADVVYVKPGFYSEGYKDTPHYVKDDQTWYIEGGAVIQGTINMDYTTNASLIGHGLIWRPVYASITVNDAVNAHIEGMMGLNHGWADNGGYFINVANSRNVYVKNLKSIGRHKWGDTMDIFCSEDVTVEGCFFRGNDDCIAIYGPRWTGNYWGDTGNVRNIKVKDCVLMPDLARPIHFGTHGDSSSPNGGRVIDNCRFENIDILTYNKYAYKTNGDGSINRMPQSIRMDVSEGNTVSNIYFNNIRIRDYMANKICELFITTQDRYGTYAYPGKGINNIYFKDIDYKNIDPTHDGRIEGYSTSDGESGMTQNVTFENLKINGEVALSAEDAQLNIGNNTKNIQFVEEGQSKYVYRPSAVPEDIWPEYYDYARLNGAEASAEVSENGSSPAAAIDGDESTVWYSSVAESSSVYNPDDKTVSGEGITIDLKTQRLINGVRITWADPSLTHDYRIYVSKDGQDWSAGHTDEHGVGAVNAKARAEYNKRVKTTWFVNQHDPEVDPPQDYIIGRYVKIIPQAGVQLDIAKLEILGELAPDVDPNNK
ncbi:MAG TPA: discoidin domain-containing protein [Candidatus Ornithomonoglobus merdipullorum]|uniref:Discoidin domain-containing protein n=1 Tax=Candidatus Ornithomonoglobus merdipullorum TaxID=2840895 RepID=A0A9D1SG48_9FIRM|nr:discoidin domain-containing protein [Candidatus Ornithomonoglobus merdipullorum]